MDWGIDLYGLMRERGYDESDAVGTTFCLDAGEF